MIVRHCTIAVQGNNEAAELFIAGELESSLQKIRGATEMSKEAIKNGCITSRNIDPSGLSLPAPIENFNFNMEGGSTASLFLCPFIISEQDPFTAGTLAAIAFNFAIISHMRSLELGSTGTQLLKKSLAVYKIALNTFPQTCDLRIVILNNIIYAKHTLGEFEEARDSFNKLKYLMNNYPSAFPVSQRCSPSLTKDDLQRVWLNLLTLTDPSVAVAA